MKQIFKLLFLAAGILFMYSSCKKTEALPYFTNGTATVLSSSVSSIVPLTADSNKVGLTLNWTSPKYATDSSNVKYVIEIDSSGRNFAKAVTKTVAGKLSTTYTNKELNAILLAYGFAFNKAYDVDVRVTSSYSNNNEQYKSNTVKIKMTPYLIPPTVNPPASGRLFIVGGATDGGWNNPVPVPTQEFGKLDSLTYVGVFNLSAAGEYLILPVNGDWSNKFSVATKSAAGLSAGGDFGYNLSDNFPGPAVAGMYLITVDFQHGKFTVIPYKGAAIPANLYIVGDATPGSWNNPVPVPTQQFTRLNSIQYQIATLPIIAGKSYLFLPKNGDWGNKYAVNDNTIAGLADGGYIGYNASQNIPGPAVAGNYKIDVNFGVSKSASEPATALFKTTKL